MQKKDENKITFNDMFLASGNDLVLGNIVVKHPTIDSIYSLGNGIDCEDVYWNYVSTILCDPYSHMVMLDDMGIDYETQTPFDIFVMKWKQLNELYKENKEIYDSFLYHPILSIKNALNFFLGEHDFNIAFDADSNQYALVDSKSFNNNDSYDYIIDSNIFVYIHEFLTKINQIDNGMRINPANAAVKKILIEDMRDEIELMQKQNRKQESINHIGKSIISICGGGDGSANYINIKQYKVFQLLSTLKVKVKQLHSLSLLQGVYAGTLDSSKINKKELDWI